MSRVFTQRRGPLARAAGYAERIWDSRNRATKPREVRMIPPHSALPGRVARALIPIPLLTGGVLAACDGASSERSQARGHASAVSSLHVMSNELFVEDDSTPSLNVLPSLAVESLPSAELREYGGGPATVSTVGGYWLWPRPRRG
jgi:hypothetical protein